MGATHVRGAVCAALVAGLVALTGCSSTNIEGKKIDYKSAARGPQLEVPPDLTNPVYDDRYKAIGPAGQPGAAQAGSPAARQANTVLPTIAEARLERAGSQRWLVVKASPEVAWRVTRETLIESGFALAVEQPDLGVMETEWLENRAKLPTDIVTSTVSRVLSGINLGSAYSTGTLDRFRARIERGIEAGTTEIYVSHQGREEVTAALSGGTATNFVWQPTPPNPELEAIFLQRILMRFGASEMAAAQTVAGAAQSTLILDRARLERSPDGAPQLVVDDPFDRAWRRVGLALDRIGFTVVDRDRNQGLYFVRFADPDSRDPRKPDGFLARTWQAITSPFSKDTEERPEQYRVVVTELPSTSVVVVQDPKGGVDRSPSAQRILTLLQEQLK
jgi:outer membrane protein assembly factor BamC